MIPNSGIYTRAVTVRTAFATKRSEYDIGIGYGDDVGRACAAIVEALRTLDGIEQEPAPEAIPRALDGLSVNLRVRWWTDSRRASVVHARGRVIAAGKQALGRAGIDLPFPTQVLLLHDQSEATDGNHTRHREGWPAGDRPTLPRRRKEALGKEALGNEALGNELVRNKLEVQRAGTASGRPAPPPTPDA